MANKAKLPKRLIHEFVDAAHDEQSYHKKRTHRRRATGMTGYRLTVLALLTLPLSGNAMLIRHDREIDEYRKLAAQSQFDCVGRVRRSDRKDWASGVLVSPHWVLTAAHVVDKGVPEDYEWEFNGKSYKAIQHVLHPSRLKKRSRKERYVHFDLALVRIEKAVTNVAPALLYKGEKEEGLIATYVGNGLLGDGKNGPQSPRVQGRLAGRNRVETNRGQYNGAVVSTNYLLCDFDAPNVPETLDLEACPSHGDSGGALFLQVEDAWVLAGIISAPVQFVEGKSVKGVRDRYGAILAAVRVSRVADWIKKNIEIADEARTLN